MKIITRARTGQSLSLNRRPSIRWNYVAVAIGAVTGAILIWLAITIR
jgi:hypothetical protein